MENENKKVNNAEAENPKPQKAIDEITDGFYDLSSLYTAKAPQKRSTQKREEELRRKDEERRALEMQAIKEDIARRYSMMHLEATQSYEQTEKKKKPAPRSRIIQEVDERETVKEELNRIDEIINSKQIVDTGLAPVADQEEEKEEFKKHQNDFDLSQANIIYTLFYQFGDSLYSFFAKLFLIIFGIIKKPFIKLHKAISRATESTKRKTAKRIGATLKEIVNFRNEIKHAGKSIKKAIKKPLSLPSVIMHYIKKAFTRHKSLLTTAVNTLLPIGALMLLIVTVNYWNSVTFALEVIYNDQSIGYISDESVYIEAKNLVKDRLSSSAYTQNDSSVTIEETVAASPAADFNARYALSLVSVEELNDAQVISDKMIENSVDNLTHACGVYIDGEFICAVKNEADAKTVFYNILAPYEADAQANNYVVGFAETIDYVQGLYRDDKNVMWDAAKLNAMLSGEKDTKKIYTVLEGDSLDKLCDDFGVDEAQLSRLNPDYDWDEIQPGDVIIIKDAVKFISIRKIVTSTSTREIEFETVKRRDATKYSGYRQVQQKGVNGTERVTKTMIYIDGVLQDTDYSYETIKKPVEEIVVVGSRTSYNGVYIGEASSKGFLWPAPSCHYVSSPYGWRRSGWHNGIDLVKSGGGALGTPVIASKSGRVEVVQRSNTGYGNMVLINHGDGYKTRYAHMIKGSITVSVGEYVEAGQTIGKVGDTGNSTGPHLHFEVIRHGETQNPRNYIS